VLPRLCPGFSRGARKQLIVKADLRRDSKANKGRDAESWWQQRSRLAVQFLREQQAQWLYRYFRDWRKDAFR
jgi:hypothetical protein